MNSKLERLASKYRIDDLENFWSPELFDAAGELIELNAISKPRELKKGLYSVEIELDALYEAEVLMSNRKIQKTTCDCSDFQQRKKCVHVLAALIVLRKKITKKTKTKAPTPKKKRTFNIHTILEHTTHEELKLFAKEYARRDSAFSTLLKTRFARNFHASDRSQVYDQLFGQVIRIGRDGQVKLTRPQQRILETMVRSILLHIEEAMLDKQYVDALHMFSAALRKMHMVVDRNEIYAEVFEHTLSDIYKKLKMFVVAQLPPELKTEVLALCMDLAQRSQYYMPNIYDNAITAIVPMSREIDELEQIFDLIIDKVHQFEMHRLSWLAIGSILAAQSDASDQIGRIFEDMEQAIIAEVFQKLALHSEYQTMVWLAHNLPVQSYREKNQIQIWKTLLHAAKILDDFDLYKSTALQLMIALEDIRYYDQIVDIPGVPIGVIEREAEELIRYELQGEEMTELLAQFYASSQNYNALLALLVDRNDVDFFVRHDVALLPSLKHKLVEAYINLIEDFLSHYAGTANVDLIMKWKTHFEELNLFAEIDEILEKIKSAHPERQILFDEIQKRKS